MWGRLGQSPRLNPRGIQPVTLRHAKKKRVRGTGLSDDWRARAVAVRCIFSKTLLILGSLNSFNSIIPKAGNQNVIS